MKKILIGLVALIVIVIGVVVYGASQSETLIRDAVLEYAPKATGAPVILDKVNVAIRGGKAGLSGLTVGNPSGFKAPHAFKVDDVSVELDVGSLLKDVIRIKEIRIEGADLIYEIGTKGNNISKIQKNIEAYTESLGVKSSESESQAKFIVDHIYINGTKVKLASDLMAGKGAGLTLPDIHLKNIGTEDKAATAGEVATATFSAINKGLGKIITKDMLDNALGDVKKKLGDIFK
ncbi:AsmA family protein [Paremcibacter congregatus]|uniref:AsmA family protein n=1 Tax=Paremcibacter congregatus TaxID=2043170 RepID=UPI003A8F8811